MYSTRIKSLHDEYKNMLAFCEDKGQVSYAMSIKDIYTRSLLLSAASYFEVTITKIIHDFAADKSNNNEIVAFIDNKAVSRQYHTYFSWDAHNANAFFGLFGDTFRTKVNQYRQKKALSEAEEAFLYIGRERNRLVHQNYIDAQINATFDEIYEKYEKACRFLELFYEMLHS